MTEGFKLDIRNISKTYGNGVRALDEVSLTINKGMFGLLGPDAMHERPITDLNLSVRARKCMVRLGLSTIGELLRRTGDELLECNVTKSVAWIERLPPDHGLDAVFIGDDIADKNDLIIVFGSFS